MSSEPYINVWDPIVRIFHWTLVISFAITFLTEDDFMRLHSWAGYTIGILLLVRILWGFIGTHHARFSDFVFSPAIVISHLRDVVLLRAKRHVGHNPAGGAMIVLLLLSLTAATISGIALYGVAENAGPLASYIGNLGYNWEDVLEDSHEFIANFTLFLIFFHVAGVVFQSVLQNENLVRAMITGHKRRS